eukprot:TRINITY_DN15110_c0_g1_i3.p1 TRINITY_DN15110_c0_g1~~TRINITY_DN15110_c0_g1_i3.p1  ORF type:complete len:546 (-),score=166.69 TRINITY_DN15110_c0_g1_i3:377-2014(-)
MDEFSGMNYRDLQKLAKTAGVKANLPKAELLQALRDHAANASILTDDEDPPIEDIPQSDKKERNSEGKLNTTFDKESTDDNKEGEDVLNRTFDKDEDSVTNQPRRSSTRRLTTEKVETARVANETKNSPAPRKRSSVNNQKDPEPMSIPAVTSEKKKTPSRKSTPNARRISQIINERARTPRTSSAGKIVKPKGKFTPKVSTPRSAVKASATKNNTPGSKKKAVGGTNIPRFVKYARKVPDFSKIHAKEFNKMESLDQYMDKKKKRIENTIEDQRIQKAKQLGDEHNKLMEKMRARAGFVPSVTSTSKLNFNFGGTKTPGKGEPFKFTASAAPAQGTSKSAHDEKVQAVKKKPERAQIDVKNTTKSKRARVVKPVPTPANKAPGTATKSIKTKEIVPKAQVNPASAVKAKPIKNEKAKVEMTPARAAGGVGKATKVTPSRTGGKAVPRTPASVALGNITNRSVNCAPTPGSSRKQNAFDLKASLAKPLGYKPHTGKLPTFGEKKKVTELRNVTTKDVMDRARNIIKGVRMNKRAALLLQNRNIAE